MVFANRAAASDLVIGVGASIGKFVATVAGCTASAQRRRIGVEHVDAGDDGVPRGVAQTARSPASKGNSCCRVRRAVSAPSGRTWTGVASVPMCIVNRDGHRTRRIDGPQPHVEHAGAVPRRIGEQHVATGHVCPADAAQIHRDAGDRAHAVTITARGSARCARRPDDVRAATDHLARWCRLRACR